MSTRTYYTIGIDKYPCYDPRTEPQHCFKTEKRAQKELTFMQGEFPEMKFTHVWKVEVVSSRTYSKIEQEHST
jgi:hypothetical protein